MARNGTEVAGPVQRRPPLPGVDGLTVWASPGLVTDPTNPPPNRSRH
jgi:hypothetical protein